MTLLEQIDTDPAEALTALLARWRQAPDPVLADAIDVVSAKAAAPAFGGTLAKQMQAALGAVAKPDMVQLPAILDAAARQRGIDPVSDLLDALLASWPPDPRIGTALMGWIERPPWTSQRSQRIWRRAFRLLEALGDARIQRLAEVDTNRAFPGLTGDFVGERIARLLGRPFAPSTASQAQRAGWEAVLARHADRARREAEARASIEALRDAVLDAPDDLGARMVWADALSELGDPRGELVLLQLEDAAGELDRSRRIRMNALLKAHEADWLGPVDAVFAKTGRVWERGFLVRGNVRPKSREVAESAVGHPAWRLIRSVDLTNQQGTGWRGVELVAQPATTALREVRGILDSQELRRILTDPTPRPLASLGLVTSYWPVDGIDFTPEVARVRALERLELTPGWRHCLPGLATVFTRIDRLVLVAVLSLQSHGNATTPAEAVDQLRQMARMATHAEVQIHHGGLVMTAIAYEGEIKVHLHDGQWGHAQQQALMAALQLLADGPGLHHIRATRAWRNVLGDTWRGVTLEPL
ncbi:MAG: TIGR02996 domain-containing protein [Alphaproteobacteria bacterium]|nr:TIGR02996 domain-containing protein [Alphaproteobacteria bacterium]